MAVKRNKPVTYYYAYPRPKSLTGLSPFLIIELRNLIYYERKTAPKNKKINIKFNFRFGLGFIPMWVLEIVPGFYKLYNIDNEKNINIIANFTESDLINEYQAVQNIF